MPPEDARQEDRSRGDSMTPAEIDALPQSDDERYAEKTYRYLQEQGRIQGYMTEGQLLEASGVVGTLAARNKRWKKEGLLP